MAQVFVIVLHDGHAPTPPRPLPRSALAADVVNRARELLFANGSGAAEVRLSQPAQCLLDTEMPAAGGRYGRAASSSSVEVDRAFSSCNVGLVSPWSAFERDRPDLAHHAARLLYRFGVGLGFLGTVRADGGPRLHPICPILAEGGLFAFIVPSPKQDDLKRDGRFALHSFPGEHDEDAIYLTGRAERRDDAGQRTRLSDQFVAERAALDVPAPADDELVFEFLIDRVLWTKTCGHGDPEPQHTVWRPVAGRDG